jgi:hypothetical protein
MWMPIFIDMNIGVQSTTKAVLYMRLSRGLVMFADALVEFPILTHAASVSNIRIQEYVLPGTANNNFCLPSQNGNYTIPDVMIPVTNTS